MKIQFISKKYLPAAGGAEKSIHDLLIYVHRQGAEIQVVTEKRESRKNWSTQFTIIEIGGTTEIAKQIKEFKPDVIFTQIDWDAQVIELARKYKIPCVFFSRVGDVYFNADLIVFNSNFVRNKWIIDYPLIADYSLTLYPTILAENLCQQVNPGKYVLCINPVKAKGGEIIRRIALAMPEVKFLATIGWCHPNDDGVDLASLKNVTIIPAKKNLQELCEESFVLLMPSIWEEPFGRVIIEAMSAGLPVIASNIGGIPEAMGGAGILIDNYQDINAWVTAIIKLNENKKFYKEQKKLCLKRAQMYIEESSPKFLLKTVNAIIIHYKGPRKPPYTKSPYVNGQWFINLKDPK